MFLFVYPNIIVVLLIEAGFVEIALVELPLFRAEGAFRSVFPGGHDLIVEVVQKDARGWG